MCLSVHQGNGEEYMTEPVRCVTPHAKHVQGILKLVLLALKRIFWKSSIASPLVLQENGLEYLMVHANYAWPLVLLVQTPQKIV